MRIAHVTDCYLPRVGGIETLVRDLACRQVATGHEVEIVTATPPPVNGDPPGIVMPTVRRLRPDVRQPGIRQVLAGFAVDDVLTGGDYDLVHVHASMVSPLAVGAAVAAARARIPVVVTLHSVLTGYGSLTRVALAATGIGALPIAWSAVSEAAAAPLRSALAPGSQVAVLRNGVEPAHWQCAPTPTDPAFVRIVSVMRVSRRKRPLPLVRMLRQVRAAVDPDIAIEAVIVGDGPQLGRVRTYLRRHDMGWVRLTGVLPRADIATLLATADVYVAPARLESFGIAALEARCAGVPVVAHSCGGIGEFVTSGREGLLSDSDADMVRVLGALVENTELRAAMAAHNREVGPDCTWDDVLARTEQQYERALQLAAPGPRVPLAEMVDSLRTPA